MALYSVLLHHKTTPIYDSFNAIFTVYNNLVLTFWILVETIGLTNLVHKLVIEAPSYVMWNHSCICVLSSLKFFPFCVSPFFDLHVTAHAVLFAKFYGFFYVCMKAIPRAHLPTLQASFLLRIVLTLCVGSPWRDSVSVVLLLRHSCQLVFSFSESKIWEQGIFHTFTRRSLYFGLFNLEYFFSLYSCFSLAL